jgi:hypothetical protein
MDSEPASKPEATYEPPPTQMPTALVCALQLQLIGSLVHIAIADFQRDRMLLGHALPLVCLPLAIAGALELLRGSRGHARLGVKLMLGALGMGLAAKIGLELRHLDPAVASPLPPPLGAWRALFLADAACWPAVTLGLLVCSWRDRTVRWLALPLLAASLIPGSHGTLDLRALLGLTRQGAFALAMMIEIFYVFVFLFALFRCAPIADPIGGWERAARALERAARALRLWMALSIGGLALLIAASIVSLTFLGSSTRQLLELSTFGVPFGIVLAQGMLISGVLGAAGLTMLDAPRLRLYASAALLLLVTSLSALQLAAGRAGHTGHLAQESDALLLPSLGIAALALYLTSLRGFITLLNAQRLADRLSYSLWIIVCMLLIHLGCQRLTSSAGSLGMAIVCTAAGVMAQAFVLHNLAGLTSRMAAQLHLREKLPTASLRQRRL